MKVLHKSTIISKLFYKFQDQNLVRYAMTERNVLRRSSDNFGKFSESIHNIVSETISINVDVGTRSSDAMSSFKEILPDLKKIVDEKRSQGK